MWGIPKGIDKARKQLSDFFAIRDKRGNSSLHYIVQTDDKEFAEKLIAVGCDVNAKNGKGEPPLVLAIRENQVEMVKILLSAGANCDVNYFPNKRGPLHLAAYYGSPEIVQLLIEHGVDVNAQDNRQQTPLHFSIEFNKENEQDNRLKIVKMLVIAGADINAVAFSGMTPLLATIESYFPAAFEFLLSSGADFNSGGNNVLTYLRRAIDVDNSTIFKRLIELGNDVNMREEDDICLLHYAAEDFCVEIISYMFDNNALITIDDDGFDPLCYGLQRWSDFYINSFNTATDDHDKELEEMENNSLYFRQMECMNLFIERGVNLNTVTNDGMTSLYFVIRDYQKQHSNFVRVLLKNGATFDFEHDVVRHLMNNYRDSKFPHLLLRHTALFEAQDRTDGPANFDVNKLNNKSLQDYTGCRDELELMKSTKIADTNVSVFNVLVDRDIGPYARNDSIISEFEKLNISEYFPIYSDLLCDRFAKEVKLQKLVKQARDSLARVMNWDSDSMFLLLN